jgi:hypothetical protein
LFQIGDIARDQNQRREIAREPDGGSSADTLAGPSDNRDRLGHRESSPEWRSAVDHDHLAAHLID